MRSIGVFAEFERGQIVERVGNGKSDADWQPQR